MQTKVQLALRTLKERLDADEKEKPLTFQRVLLKFHILRDALEFLQAVFTKLDSDGNGVLDKHEVIVMMRRLQANMDDKAIEDLFDLAQVSDAAEDAGGLSFREFLVSLCLGYVMGVIPDLDEEMSSAVASAAVVVAGAGVTPPAAAAAAASPASSNAGTPSSSPAPKTRGLERKSSVWMGHSTEVKAACFLMVRTWMMFDLDGDATISRTELETILDEQQAAQGQHGGKKTGQNNMLSKARWDEMDWNSDGEIDFFEFIYAFSKWIISDEELQEVGEDDDDSV